MDASAAKREFDLQSFSRFCNRGLDIIVFHVRINKLNFFVNGVK